MIAAPAAKAASARMARTGGEARNPVMTLTPPKPIVSAAMAARSTRRTVGWLPFMARSPHRPGDDEPLDLVRALVDLRDLGVAHHPLHRIFLDVAVAAEDLDGLDRDLHRRVGAEQLGHRRVLADIRVGRMTQRRAAISGAGSRAGRAFAGGT